MWNQNHYNNVRDQCIYNIKNHLNTPFDYMMEYKRMIIKEDYEAAKAITEVLLSLTPRYNTTDTHQHIKILN